jgi:hypothetical protein
MRLAQSPAISQLDCVKQGRREKVQSMRLTFGMTGQAELSQVAFTSAGPVSILRPIQVRFSLGDGRGDEL